VHALVFSRGIEKLLIAAEDDVAEGHGAGPATQQGAVAQEPADQAAVQFKHALDHAYLPAAEQRRHKKQQADQRRGQHPEVDKDSWQTKWEHELPVYCKRL